MQKRYYIKCDRCQSLVEIKSQYMVMCPHCKRKMNNSFTEWQHKNPQGEYRDYLQGVCVSSDAIKGVGEQRRITRLLGRKRSFKWLSVALAVAVLVTALSITGYYLYERAARGASIKSLLAEGWKLDFYEDLSVTLKFPYQLEAASAVAVDSAGTDSTQVVISSVVRRWSRPDVANVSALKIDYKPDFGVDRQAATEQILMAVVSENNIQGFRYVPSDYSMGNGIKARMLSGSYLIDIKAYEFRAVMAIRDNTVWYFMVSYLREMPEGTLLAEKFFNGILIN